MGVLKNKKKKSSLIPNMKIFAVLAISVTAQTGCSWFHGNSGQHVSCLPAYYINGVCGSGSRDDCRFTGSGTYSFGINCCPEDRSIKVGDKSDCAWIGAENGKNVICPEGKAAFGRCETSQRNDGGGSCNNLSHQAECCTSDLSVAEEKCGWIFDNYGTKVNCPSGLVATGFCGVNNHQDCDSGNAFVGIRCCPPM